MQSFQQNNNSIAHQPNQYSFSTLAKVDTMQKHLWLDIKEPIAAHANPNNLLKSKGIKATKAVVAMLPDMTSNTDQLT